MQGRAAEGLSVVSSVLWKVTQEHKKNFEDGSCYKIQKAADANALSAARPRGGGSSRRRILVMEGMYV